MVKEMFQDEQTDKARLDVNENGTLDRDEVYMTQKANVSLKKYLLWIVVGSAVGIILLFGAVFGAAKDIKVDQSGLSSNQRHLQERRSLTVSSSFSASTPHKCESTGKYVSNCQNECPGTTCWETWSPYTCGKTGRYWDWSDCSFRCGKDAPSSYAQSKCGRAGTWYD